MLLQENYLGNEELKLLAYEQLSYDYGFLPSEINKEDASIVEGYLLINAHKRKENIEKAIK